MHTKCPHCGKDIDVVTAKELDEEYGINSNRLQYAKTKERFPRPWLSYTNRDLYLRNDIAEYVSRASREEAERDLANLRSRLGTLPREEAEKLLDELRDAVGNGQT